MQDCHWLNTSPAYPDAIHWSEENLILISSTNNSIILNPYNLTGPRSYIYQLIPKEPIYSQIHNEWIPEDSEHSIEMYIKSLDMKKCDQDYKLIIKSVCWSPIGCTNQGGCLMACVTSDGQIIIYGPDDCVKTAVWKPIIQLSSSLKEFMKENNYMEINEDKSDENKEEDEEENKNQNFSLDDVIKRDEDDKKKSINKRKWSNVSCRSAKSSRGGRPRGTGRSKGRTTKSSVVSMDKISKEEEISDNVDVRDINVVPEDKVNEETNTKGGNTTNNNKTKNKSNSNVKENEDMKFYVTNENFIMNTEDELINFDEEENENELSKYPRIKGNNYDEFRFELPRLFLAMWLELRSKYDERYIPQYKKNECLKGLDLQLYKIVYDKIIKTYGETMEKYGLNEKWLVKYSKKTIRNKAIGSYTPVWRGTNFYKNDLKISNINNETKIQNQLNTTDSDASTLITEDESDDENKDNLILKLRKKNKPKILSTRFSAVSVYSTISTVRNVVKQSKSKFEKSSYMDLPMKSNKTYSDYVSTTEPNCIAWSSVFNNKTMFSLLAVGLGSGHIFFWKYSLSTYSELLSNELTNSKFEILGPCIAYNSPISKIKFFNIEKVKNKQLLIVGHKSGASYVYEIVIKMDTENIDMTNGGIIFNLLGIICEDDMMCVTCLSAGIVYKENGYYLRIGIGKTGGVIIIYNGPLISNNETQDCYNLFHQGNTSRMHHIHDRHEITGIIVDMPKEMLCTVGLDSKVKCWIMEDDHMQLIYCPEVDSEIDYYNEAFQPIFGICNSNTGIHFAIIKDAGRKLFDSAELTMVFKRLVHATIEIPRIYGQYGLISVDDALEHFKKVINYSSKNVSSCVNDIASLILYFQSLKQRETEEKNVNDIVNVSSIKIESNVQNDDTVDIMDFDKAYYNEMKLKIKHKLQEMNPILNSDEKAKSVTLDILNYFEEDFNNNKKEDFLNLPEKSLQKIKASVALRRILKNRIEIPKNEEKIEEIEMHLLQYHIYKVFNHKNDKINLMFIYDLFPLIQNNIHDIIYHKMAKWLYQSHNKEHYIFPSLLTQAKSILESNNANEMTEKLQLSDKLKHRYSNHPIMAIKTADVKIDEFTTSLNTCMSTLLICENLAKWKCKLCKCYYTVPPEYLQGTEINIPYCLFCGMQLSIAHDETYILKGPGCLKLKF